MKKGHFVTLKKADEAQVNEPLVQARLERQWSQEEVAERIGTTHVSVSRWERGLAFPNLYFRKKLCGIYGKTEEALGLSRKQTKSKKASPQRQRAQEREQVPGYIWNVPYRESPFFTGRTDLLHRIHKTFSANTGRIATVAISGLGGMGKTLTAIEYAHRHRSNYSAVLWANAEDATTLASDFEKIAGKHALNLPEQDQQDQHVIVSVVQHWLCTHSHWLLILDNVEDLQVVYPFLPQVGHGCVLLTTRDRIVGDMIDEQIPIDKMEWEEAALFLLRRTRTLPKDSSLKDARLQDQEMAKAIADVLDGLPLALDQAGAYIDETHCSFSEYLDLYQQQHQVLLQRPSRQAVRYRETVATTWAISFQKIERANPTSADLLRFLAFLHADAIPEEIVLQCAQDLGPFLQSIDTQLAFHHALEELIKYSFVQRQADNQTMSIHRLVQTVLKDNMDEHTQLLWAERCVRAVNQTFSVGNEAPIGLCERYYSHALMCTILITQWHLTSREAAHLLHKTGAHALVHSQYRQAQYLLLQALTIYEQAPERETIEIAGCLKNLAQAYEFQGDVVNAEMFHLKAHALYEQCFDSDHPRWIEALNNLLHFYIKQYKLNEAKPLLERVIAIIETRQDITPETRLHSLHARALFYLANGQFAEAEPLFSRVLALHEQVRGPGHPSQISILNGFVFLYMNQGKFVEAEPLCQSILEIAEHEVVPLLDLIACHQSNLATIYNRQGKFDKAEQMYHKALTTREQIQGADPLEIATIHNNLGRLYSKQGRLNEAEQHYQQALLLVEKEHGREDPRIAYFLENIARIHQKQGKYDDIEQLSQRALAILSNTLGPDHPETVFALNNLAAFYSSQEQYALAEPLYKQALAIIERTQKAYPVMEQVVQGYLHVQQETGRGNEVLAMKIQVSVVGNTASSDSDV